jgi:hypothetical protein
MEHHAAVEALAGAELKVLRVRFAQAYALLEPEIVAIPADDCRTVNLDVQATAMLAIGAIQRTDALRARFRRDLPSFDLRRLERLGIIAGAAWHAQTLLDALAAPPPASAELARRALAARNVLVCEIRTLIARELLPAESLKNMVGGSGYRQIAKDLTLGVNVLRTNWERVVERTGVRFAELAEYERLGDQLVHAVVEPEPAAQRRKALALNRQRAFTLLMRAYEELRNAVRYLRTVEGDAEELTPSPYKRDPNARRRRKKKAREAAAGEGGEPGVSAGAERSVAPPRAAEEVDRIVTGHQERHPRFLAPGHVHAAAVGCDGHGAAAPDLTRCDEPPGQSSG